MAEASSGSLSSALNALYSASKGRACSTASRICITSKGCIASFRSLAFSTAPGARSPEAGYKIGNRAAETRGLLLHVLQLSGSVAAREDD